MVSIAVIGANKGIGLEIVKQLIAKSSNQVFATCRKSSPALTELSAAENLTVLENIDIAKDEVVNQLQSSNFPAKLDAVICNAGFLSQWNNNGFDDLNFEHIAYMYNVNSIGPLRVAKGFESRLGEGSKYAIITSRAGSIEDNSSGGLIGYRMSKTAVNAAGKSLSIDLKPKGVAVGLLHPGFVKTGMTEGNGLITAAESATCIIEAVERISIGNTGQFWHAIEKEEIPW